MKRTTKEIIAKQIKENFGAVEFVYKNNIGQVDTLIGDDYFIAWKNRLKHYKDFESMIKDKSIDGKTIIDILKEAEWECL